MCSTKLSLDAIELEQKYRALAFFLNWPCLDLAAKLALNQRAEWEGRHCKEALLAAAETLEPDHPVAATILYRALLDDILNRVRSPAYGHAARYLEKLDALAAHGDAASSIDPHHAYRVLRCRKSTGGKVAFGASSRCESDPKPDVPAELLHAQFGNVTKPPRALFLNACLRRAYAVGDACHRADFVGGRR